MELRHRRGAGLRRAAAVCALALAAGLTAFAGDVAHIRTDFLAWGRPHANAVTPGDHLQATYNLWLPGHELEHGRAPWRDPYSFRPETDGRTNFAAWPFGVPFWPLHAVFGTIGGWNAFVLFTYVVSFACAALWLRALGLPEGAALAGALAFALAPYRSAQTAAGHLLAPVSMLVPLTLYALEVRRDWLTVAALASIPLSGQVHLALAAIPFALAYAYVRGRTRVGLAAAAVAVGTGIVVYLTAIRGTIGASGRSFAQVERYSAEPVDFLTRHARHGLESFAFLGWLVPLAALAGLVLLARRDRALAVLLGAAVALPLVLALGANTPLYEPLWHVVPGLRHTRVPERFLPLACLALAALAAYAVARVPGRLAVVAACALVVLDLHVDAYTPLGGDEHNAVYAQLRGRPGRVLERPIYLPDRHEGSVYLYYTLQAPHERPLGYSTTAPVIVDVTARRLRKHPDYARRLGVGSVVEYAEGRPARIVSP
jgi:hypothetical protein